MMQEPCDKTSVSPTPTAPHNNLSSGLSPLGNTGHNDPSSVTKEERSSRHRGQSTPSPSKSHFVELARGGGTRRDNNEITTR